MLPIEDTGVLASTGPASKFMSEQLGSQQLADSIPFGSHQLEPVTAVASTAVASTAVASASIGTVPGTEVSLPDCFDNDAGVIDI